LSIIAPDQCNFDFIGSFYLNSEHIWKRIDQDDNTQQLQ